MKLRKSGAATDGARKDGAEKLSDERAADIERKRKKLKTAALIAQAFCGVLALIAVVVIAVVVCKQ